MSKTAKMTYYAAYLGDAMWATRGWYTGHPPGSWAFSPSTGSGQGSSGQPPPDCLFPAAALPWLRAVAERYGGRVVTVTVTR